ncbi:response regulator [Paraburkholderia saeva]|uniref:response regulator n=1 Tax=Paraburkholderia saeva TaxID=2777537 RepID=UPI001E5F530B|nr:hypothetical protein [Paraburkholderia saeva]
MGSTLLQGMRILLADDAVESLQACQNLRGLVVRRCVPALAMTGFTRQQDIARAIRAGYNGHLAKPVSLQSLLDRIADVTGRLR